MDCPAVAYIEIGGALSELKIRSYIQTDHQAVLRLHVVALEGVGVYFGGGMWDQDLLNIEKTYLENNGAFLVGLINQQIVAMGALRRISAEKGEIKRMRTLPSFQGRGFGQIILNALEKEAVGLGYKILCLDTTVLQVAAQRLYLKNDYKEVTRVTEGYPFEMVYYSKEL